MLKRAVRRYDQMRKELETDPEYQALDRELRELEPRFQAAGASPRPTLVCFQR